MIKEFKELENISMFEGSFTRSMGPWLGECLNYFLVREEDEKKNYKIKLAIKRMYNAVKDSKAKFTDLVTRPTFYMKLYTESR